MVDTASIDAHSKGGVIGKISSEYSCGEPGHICDVSFVSATIVDDNLVN